ncbi:hypothetical protein SK128_020945, partial [Halocaridina rubra]
LHEIKEERIIPKQRFACSEGQDKCLVSIIGYRTRDIVGVSQVLVCEDAHEGRHYPHFREYVKK